MTNEERKAALEAIIYAADEPATIEQLAVALDEERLAVQSSLDELVASYATEERGIEIRAVAGGYKLPFLTTGVAFAIAAAFIARLVPAGNVRRSAPVIFLLWCATGR